MKKHILFIISILLLAGINIVAQDYVGPEKCISCHGSIKMDASGWRTSMHANGYTAVLDDSRSMEDLYGVVNDYDGNGIDDFKDGLNFNDITSNFDVYKPNAPILAYSAENGYTIQMGDVTHKVFMTYGGSGLYKQRYMMKVETSEGLSAGYYVSPVQYNEATDEYVVYHGSDWYDANNNNVPIYTSATGLAAIAGNSRNIAKNCSGCHSNGLELWQDANGEWLMKGAPHDNDALYADMVNVFDIDGDGALDQINTTCERCHGPGAAHAASLNPADIINPRNLTADEANNLCGMCHSRGKSKPNNTFGFPFQDDADTLVTWNVGDMVADIYENRGGDWGDGVTSSSHHQQFWDLYESSKPSFEFHQVTCFECHDVHNEVKHHIREEIPETDSLGAAIMVTSENDNNTLCLSCHATHGAFEDISVEMVADYDNNVDGIGAIVSLHTNHSYDPTGIGTSRCSKCHMAKTAKSAVAYDVHGHTFEVLAPEKTMVYNMPNSCAVSCHGNAGATGSDFGNNVTTADRTDWGGKAQQGLATFLMNFYGPEGSWWTGDPVSVGLADLNMPSDFKLSQNYPNPFNPTTTINFSVPKEGFVKVAIYNAVGEQVDVLVNSHKNSGNYVTGWNATNFASGVYYYRLETDNFVETKKMLLMK
jgi:Secretion system C-terminal sorting domain